MLLVEKLLSLMKSCLPLLHLLFQSPNRRRQPMLVVVYPLSHRKGELSVSIAVDTKD